MQITISAIASLSIPAWFSQVWRGTDFPCKASAPAATIPVASTDKATPALAQPNDRVMTDDLEELVSAHYKNLYYFALSLCRNEADASDLTQQTFFKLTKHHAKIRNAAKVKGWLFSTLYRDFVDRQRRQKFQSDTPVENYASEIAHESTKAVDRLDGQVVMNAMMALDDALRQPLTLFYLEDYSYREIADILGIPMGTVMSRLHRGKEILHRTLTAEPPLAQAQTSND